MKRSTAVTETAQVLFSAETAIDSAFGQTAILASRLAQVRMEMGLSAVVGQRVFDAVTATLNELSQARAEIVRAHTELADVKIRIGCATVATGGGDKEDTDIVQAPARRALAAVA
jgi:hypothetical protein